MEFSLRPKVVLIAMLSMIALLSILHIGQLIIYFQVADERVFDFVRLLDFDFEGNLPSLYSHMALFFAAGLLWLIALHKFRAENAAYRYHWIILALIFTFLGFDEALALHEEVGDFFENKQWVNASGYLFFAWVVPYGVLLTIFVLSYLRFLLSLPRATMIGFVVAGALFVTGAVGFEIISAQEADIHGVETVFYSAIYTIEEICEMCGIAIFCYTLLRYIAGEDGYIRFGVA